jgi:putative ABC transport system permease protein
MVDLARKNLLHDKLRFMITVSGVAFAVTLVLVQVGLFAGLLDNSTITINHLNADLWITSHNTPNVDFAHTYPESYVERVRSVPGVQRADNLIVWFMQMSLPNGAQEGTEVYALENAEKWNFPWSYSGARLADLRRGPYFFLDDSARKRFGPFSIGEYREIVGYRMQIIGQTNGARSFTTTPLTFMDYDRIQAMSPQLLRGNTTYTVVKLARGADAGAVCREIQRRLPYNDVYTGAEWARRSRNYWIESTGLGLNMYLTVFLGCLVGVVVVAQTLYTSTMEHLKEFGTVKAIGGSNLLIYRIVGQQASIAAVFGFIIGGAMALLLQPALSKVQLNMVLTPAFGAVVFLGTLVLCLAASAISFRKIAAIDPALVFRT